MCGAALFVCKYIKPELSETGNYYYGARYYDPKWSIFISVDPLAEKTMDAYGYCYQNPVRFTDPTGMAPDHDYGIDKKTGKITLLRTNKDSTSDRLIGLNKNGEETNTVIENIAPGILKDGMNFKENYNLIEIGGHKQPTEDQFKEFIVNYSNYFAYVEVSGYWLGSDYSDKISAVLVEPHKRNTYNSSWSVNLHNNQKLQTYRIFGDLFGDRRLFPKKHYHTHPRNGVDITNPSREDIQNSRDKNIDHNLYYWDDSKQSVIDKPYKKISDK